jgi:hypothetical protein
VKALEKNGERTALVDFPFTLLRMTAAEARDFIVRNLLVAGYAFPRYKASVREAAASRRSPSPRGGASSRRRRRS